MKRKRDPRITDPAPRQLGLLWGLVAAILVVLSPFAGRFGATLPACPLKTLVGVPCPTCGTARCAIALAGFDPISALMINPLAACAWMALVAGGLWAGANAVRGVGIGEPDWRATRVWGLLGAALLLLNWSYLIRMGI